VVQAPGSQDSLGCKYRGGVNFQPLKNSLVLAHHKGVGTPRCLHQRGAGTTHCLNHQGVATSSACTTGELSWLFSRISNH
jgi:hypothetical protein